MNIEIVRARQQEIAENARYAHHIHDLPDSGGRPRRSVRTRVLKAAAAVSACVAITAAIATGGANAMPKGASDAHVSTSQLNREIRGLESEGYVPWQCTTSGTRMYQSGTDRFVDVIW
jgi:hypothetical protein